MSDEREKDNRVQLHAAIGLADMLPGQHACHWHLHRAGPAQAGTDQQPVQGGFAAKEAAGFPLGKLENLTERARLKGLDVRRQNATSHKASRQATELIVMCREKGMGYQAIAERLNSHGFTTRRGKQFFAMTVQRLYQRHKQLSVEFLYL